MLKNLINQIKSSHSAERQSAIYQIGQLADTISEENFNSILDLLIHKIRGYQIGSNKLEKHQFVIEEATKTLTKLGDKISENRAIEVLQLLQDKAEKLDSLSIVIIEAITKIIDKIPEQSSYGTTTTSRALASKGSNFNTFSIEKLLDFLINKMRLCHDNKTASVSIEAINKIVHYMSRMVGYRIPTNRIMVEVIEFSIHKVLSEHQNIASHQKNDIYKLFINAITILNKIEYSFSFDRINEMFMLCVEDIDRRNLIMKEISLKAISIFPARIINHHINTIIMLLTQETHNYNEIITEALQGIMSLADIIPEQRRVEVVEFTLNKMMINKIRPGESRFYCDYIPYICIANIKIALQILNKFESNIPPARMNDVFILLTSLPTKRNGFDTSIDPRETEVILESIIKLPNNVIDSNINSIISFFIDKISQSSSKYVNIVYHSLNGLLYLTEKVFVERVIDVIETVESIISLKRNFCLDSNTIDSHINNKLIALNLLDTLLLKAPLDASKANHLAKLMITTNENVKFAKQQNIKLLSIIQKLANKVSIKITEIVLQHFFRLSTTDDLYILEIVTFASNANINPEQIKNTYSFLLDKATDIDWLIRYSLTDKIPLEMIENVFSFLPPYTKVKGYVSTNLQAIKAVSSFVNKVHINDQIMAMLLTFLAEQYNIYNGHKKISLTSNLLMQHIHLLSIIELNYVLTTITKKFLASNLLKQNMFEILVEQLLIKSLISTNFIENEKAFITLHQNEAILDDRRILFCLERALLEFNSINEKCIKIKILKQQFRTKVSLIVELDNLLIELHEENQEFQESLNIEHLNELSTKVNDEHITSSIHSTEYIKTQSVEIAQMILVRAKVIIKAEELVSNNPELEKEFIFELAKLLRVTHFVLLEAMIHNEDLKTDFIKKLANGLKRIDKIYKTESEFFIQEELRYDSDEFFESVIDQVKEQLRQKTYLDESSGQKLEVRYVNGIMYNNLILFKEKLLYEAFKLGGSEALNSLINLGEDGQIADEVIAAAEQYGAKHVVDLIFGNNGKYDINSEAEFLNGERLLIIADKTQQNPGSIPGSHKFVAQDNFIITSFTVKEAIESLPTLKYFAKEILQIQYNLPEFVDNNYFKLTAHFVATNIGAYSLIGKFSIVSSLLPTAVYGSKVLAYEYLSKQKQLNFEVQEDKSIDSPIEFAQKCGFDIAAQTALGIVSSFISGSPAIYDMAISATIGGMQCYSQYNQRDMYSSNIQPMGEKVMPYIADTMTYYVAVNNMEFDLSSTAGQMLAIKQGLTVLSSVVMSDYITKLAISSIPEEYFNCPKDGVLGRIYSNFSWECNNDEV